MYINKNEERGPPGNGSYGKPRLLRLGTFRELTRGGGTAFADLWTTSTNTPPVGCVLTSSRTYTCTK